MAVSIAWGTKVITVPKADLTLVQASPEVRELDIDWFRLALKDLEDSLDGMAFPDTHSHNTEVTLAGLTYARIVNIINGYTVEFEDGQYTVNCVGANHNLSDVKVANQVSLIVNNAAGLITNAAIEYSSFNGGVIIDVNSGISGTLFPIGTEQAKVNNLSDALLIAEFRGFNKLYLHSDLTISGADDLSGYNLVGQNHVQVDLVIENTASVDNLRIERVSIHDSVLDGDISIRDCVVGDVSYVNGHIHNCGLHGTITLGGSKESVLANCYTIDQDNPPIIDMGGSGNDLAMPNYSGLVTIKNLSSATEEIGIGLLAGMVELDSTITAGTVIVSGVGLITDNSSGANVDSSSLLNANLISDTISQMIIDSSGNTSLKEAMYGVLAALAGIAAGGGTSQITFRNQGDTADALILNVDADGNRTSTIIGTP